jgi:hypothetical protein
MEITLTVSQLLDAVLAKNHIIANDHRPLLLIPLLVGCCVVVRRPISSSHAIMRPQMLSLPDAFADNCLPPPPPPPPPPPQLTVVH